jgi:uncharacterized pyridoxamine 5'-phosphate oxidase family protein
MLSHSLSPAAIDLLGADAKVGLLATVDPDGRPHVTLITSLAAKGPKRLMFGQFSEGRSKTHVRSHPEVGFLALDGARRWLRGKAVWRSAVRQGEDFEAYNRKPMFRYNAYFGIHTVHYLDVVEVEEGGELGVPSLVVGAALARGVRIATVSRCATPALTPWAVKLVSRAATLKFASYVGEDGHPCIIPGVAACTAGSGRVVVACPNGDPAAASLPDGADVAVFALDRELHSVLLRGRATNRRSVAGVTMSALDIDWVYNSMPPKHGQIYPQFSC